MYLGVELQTFCGQFRTAIEPTVAALNDQLGQRQSFRIGVQHGGDAVDRYASAVEQAGLQIADGKCAGDFIDIRQLGVGLNDQFGFRRTGKHQR